MIIYKDILHQLKEAGFNTNYLRKEKILSESTIQRLREGKPITTDTIDKICDLLQCNVEDLIEFRTEDGTKPKKKNAAAGQHITISRY